MREVEKVWCLFAVIGIACHAVPLNRVPRQTDISHVVHIGVDGMKPSCLLNATGGAPNMFSRLAAQGTWTLTNARTIIETISGPAWTSTLCAMDSTHTGVVSNSWKPPWEGNPQPITPVTGNETPFPCAFQTIKDQDPSVQIATFYDWDFISQLMRTGPIDYEFFCDYRDFPNQYADCDALIARNASAYLQQTLKGGGRSYTFIYLIELDNKGHSHGWGSQPYLDYIATIDSQIGQVLDAIDASGKQNETLVILHSDHGGEGDNHGYQTDACLITPMFLRGPNVKVNRQFNYTVHNTDVVPTVISALGLTSNRFWQGKPMSEAFM